MVLIDERNLRGGGLGRAAALPELSTHPQCHLGAQELLDPVTDPQVALGVALVERRLGAVAQSGDLGREEVVVVAVVVAELSNERGGRPGALVLACKAGQGDAPEL